MLPILCALAFFTATQDEPKPVNEAELQRVTERGRLLHEYDQAAWHASDALMAAKPPLVEGSITGYIARKTDKGWVVAFGRLDESKSKYLIVHELTQGKMPHEFALKNFDPPQVESKFFPQAVKARETALAEFVANFSGQRRRYNAAVLPAENDEFWVYLLPAATVNGVWPLGADVRYRISADGTKVLAKRQMHRSVIEAKMDELKGNNNKLAARIHTHVITEEPEDSDVFHVLSRKPTAPEIILTKEFVYSVENDGHVKLIGKKKDFKLGP